MPRMSAMPSVSPPELPPRVPLLDDDALGRLLAGRALRERGFDVVEFDRAREALDAIEGGGFDCAVCDLPMPDIDGIEFCRRVRASTRGAALPVLMLTSLDDAEATERACEAGATDYVIKSVDWTLLVHRIRQAMHLRRLERGDGREAGASGPAGVTPAAGFEWQPAQRRLRGSADLFRLLGWADAPASVADRRLLATVAPPDRRSLRRAFATMRGGGAAVRREVEVDALAAHRLPADRLEVELTESGMMADPQVAVAQLKAVRALGAGLAVDDFGTGYSSLAYLTRLPLATLKIDRSFVQDEHASERSSAVARAIVALGANLQLRAVAEGVETVTRRDALISLGCKLQQGFLYGRAVPFDEALSLADRRAIAPHGPSLESVS